MSLLSVKNLQIKIFGQTIVDGVSFDIKPGEIVSLVGPNGAGKTMLVKAILGLQNFSGEATLEGQPVIENLHKIGYVPQYFIFDRTFPLTVFEFLNLAYRLAKNNFKEQVCSELGVEKMMDKRLGKLSGGELQRVLIAQALMNDPKLLILDEPTANVDAGGAQNFYELVKHLRDEHKTAILLISHEINMVYKYADQVICLNRSMFCSGAPHEVLAPENLKKIYQTDLEIRPHTH